MVGFSPTPQKQWLLKSGGGSGQSQLSAVMGSHADTCTVFPTFFEQLTQCGRSRALAGTISRAPLRNIATRLPNKSIFFFTRIFSLSCPLRGAVIDEMELPLIGGTQVLFSTVYASSL
jgi:hypothetical protein